MRATRSLGGGEFSVSRRLWVHRRSRLVLISACIIVIGAWFGAPQSVQASEGGTNNYAVGAETVAPAIQPPPGATEYYGYLLWFNARAIRDNSGGSSIPEFRTDFYAHAARIIHTWHETFYGWNVGSGTIYLLDYAKVKVGPTRDEDFDLSLINIEPILLSRTFGAWHFYAGEHFYAPVGSYHPSQLANPVVHYAHYYTLTPDSSVTWTPTPWFEGSINTSESFNLKNHTTDYHSGDLLGIDFGLDLRPLAQVPQLWLGANGFYEYQFTKDSLHGTTVPDSKMLRTAIGPQAIWYFSPATAVVLKWQRTFHERNTAGGDLLWLECAFPITFGQGASSVSPPPEAPVAP